MNLEKNANPFLIKKLRGFNQIEGNFSIKINASFESAHYLYDYMSDGSDEPVHGHTWKVEIEISSDDFSLDEKDICYDFIEAQNRLKELVDRIDHICINDLEEFKGINPTTENIARWFYMGLKDVLERSTKKARLLAVYIHEGPHNVAVYRPK